MAVVVSFLDEEDHLPGLLASLAAQTRRPDELLLVDDGSSDRSAELAGEFAGTHSWARLLRRPSRARERDRLATAAELQAFEWAIGQAQSRWDVVGKLDADMDLPPAVLRAVEETFEGDPLLGMTGPFIAEPDIDGQPRRKPCGRGHVEGATKFYRRDCYEQIAPIPSILGWDTIDEFRARRSGWRTGSFAAPGGDALHRRPMGSYDGVLRGFRRRGVCAYGYGSPPLHTLAYSLQLMKEAPRGVGGANFLAGYAAAALQRAPRAEADLRREVRRELNRRLLRRLRRPRRRVEADAA